MPINTLIFICVDAHLSFGLLYVFFWSGMLWCPASDINILLCACVGSEVYGVANNRVRKMSSDIWSEERLKRENDKHHVRILSRFAL